MLSQNHGTIQELVALDDLLQDGMGAVGKISGIRIMQRRMSSLMCEVLAGMFRRHGNAWGGACLADSRRQRRLRQVWVPQGTHLTRVLPQAQ